MLGHDSSGTWSCRSSLAVTMFAGHYDDPSAETGWMPERLLVENIIDALIP